MKPIFNEKMSSPEAMRILFDYAAAHPNENIDEVRREYNEVSKNIIRREFKENFGKMTSYHFE